MCAPAAPAYLAKVSRARSSTFGLGLKNWTACFNTRRRIQDEARNAAPSSTKLAASDTEFPMIMHCCIACRMPKMLLDNPFVYSMLNQASWCDGPEQEHGCLHSVLFFLSSAVDHKRRSFQGCSTLATVLTGFVQLLHRMRSSCSTPVACGIACEQQFHPSRQRS